MKRTIKILTFFIIIMILVTGVYTKFKDNFNLSLSQSINGYSVIKQDNNDNYPGIGQKKVKNKDGYFTTFTTNDNKTYKEYKQNIGSWRKNEYWNGVMQDTGCGITMMAIILSGYGYDYTPEDLRQKYYPVMNYENISSELTNYGINNSDFYYDEVNLSEENIINHLKEDKPIIICVWNNPEDNRWTSSSHYMALLAADDNMVYISNPNGLENDSKSSGWYDINEVSPYIAKALYIY